MLSIREFAEGGMPQAPAALKILCSEGNIIEPLSGFDIVRVSIRRHGVKVKKL